MDLEKKLIHNNWMTDENGQDFHSYSLIIPEEDVVCLFQEAVGYHRMALANLGSYYARIVYLGKEPDEDEDSVRFMASRHECFDDKEARDAGGWYLEYNSRWIGIYSGICALGFREEFRLWRDKARYMEH